MELIYEYQQQGFLMVQYIMCNRQDKADECIEQRNNLNTEIAIEKRKLEWLELHYIRLN
jgi:hypothetical protein